MPERGRSRRCALVLTIAVVALLGPAGAQAASPAPPAGRAYERVSPQDTGGLAALANFGSPDEVIVDDDDVLFGGGFIPTSPSGGSGAQDLYLAHRSAAGWVTTTFSPPPSSPFYRSSDLIGATPGLTGAVFLNGPAAISGAPGHSPPPTLIHRDASGGFQTIVAADPTVRPSRYLGMSRDGRTVAYASDVSPPSLPSSGGLREVYLWHADGSVDRVPVPAGEPSDCGAVAAGFDAGSSGAGPPPSTTNAVSADGSTVFVAGGGPPTASDCPPSQLYVSRGGTTTEISAPTESGVPPLDPTTEKSATFYGATPDGNVAYFGTSNQLTRDAPPGQDELYEWRAARGATPAAVTCLSCDGATPGIQASLVVSPDGAYVWFERPPDPSTGTIGLSVAHDGTTQPVADQAGGPLDGLTTDAAGDVLLFLRSHPDGTEDVDRAAVGGGSPRVTCLSCDASGAPLPADTENFAPNGQAGRNQIGPPGIAELIGFGQSISANGDAVVLHSTASLTHDATAGTDNVYLWTASQGLSLVAPDASLPEISPDGANVVFQSTAALTPDTVQVATGTLYDARIGGGLPVAAAAPACDPLGCRGVAPSPPSAPAVGSVGRTAGQVTGARSGSVRLGRLRAPRPAMLRSFVRGGRLRLRIAVTAGATVRAEMRTRGGSDRVLAAGRARARGRQRTMTIALTLPRAARAAAAARALPVTLTVTASGGATRTLRFTLPRRSA